MRKGKDYAGKQKIKKKEKNGTTNKHQWPRIKRKRTVKDLTADFKLIFESTIIYHEVREEHEEKQKMKEKDKRLGHPPSHKATVRQAGLLGFGTD